jgi:ABC-type sulfate/molybdate transport systems ATPase subunit
VSFLEARFVKELQNFNLDINISLSEGKSLALYGRSGSGKSLTLRLIAGLLQPEMGYLSIDSNVLLDTEHKINLPPQKRQVGFVFQHYALFPHLTVAGNISYGIPKSKKASHDKIVQKLLSEMHLSRFADRYPSQLSGGQQQRVALARALAAQPKLLLLDEPFSALDTELRRELEELLLHFRKIHNLPIILVTHNLEEAYRLCDDLAIIENGQILQMSDKEIVLRNPLNPDVASKIGARNIWQGQVVARGEKGGVLEVPILGKNLRADNLPDTDHVWVGIRPAEAILWSGTHPENPNTFPAYPVRETRGVQSHTLYLTFENDELQAYQSTPFTFEVEVPSHRYTEGPYFISFPPDKLFLTAR